MAYNTWLPGNNLFTYGTAGAQVFENTMHFNGSLMLALNVTIPTAQSGFGMTSDAVDPPFQITKPPKLCYQADQDLVFSLKDASGWLWDAPCPEQPILRERGWEWAQFTLATVQDEDKEGLPAPGAPNMSGNIQAIQVRGADGVHGSGGTTAIQVSLGYIAGRTPSSAANGDIRRFTLTDTNPNAHTLKVGTIGLLVGSRREIKYYGALPFGFQSNGPRDRLAVLPYRGPLIAGYQSGTPWVGAMDNEKLGGVLDFMLESQTQFRNRSPNSLLGPFMHCYLIATWDCEQNGPLDSWVWDAPDGNPAWNGWQYRAFDSMGHTWYQAILSAGINTANRNKVKLICERFLTWLHDWMQANPDADYIPSVWGPEGWSQGIPLPPDSYLDPRGTAKDSHDMALSLKGTIFCALAGADPVVCRYVIRRLLKSLVGTQVNSPTDPLRGAFTLSPATFEVYGFHQGEILDALGLALAHPELLK